ncbi:hypothetical protein BDP27DRAFT_1450125 [Rhodocollybia butyracea]|uniref:Transmembrane protein n=1 Tax=Rhodocollybia butyracea TaxID=206335 RepID=A0A9P5PLX7_9AGAR|nr:hypothetical protein BDP27DRAFT_1450125 [Rhodocollybia butyracea]
MRNHQVVCMKLKACVFPPYYILQWYVVHFLLINSTKIHEKTRMVFIIASTSSEQQHLTISLTSQPNNDFLYLAKTIGTDWDEDWISLKFSVGENKWIWTRSRRILQISQIHLMVESIALFALLNAALVSSVVLVPKSVAAEGPDIVNSPDAINIVLACSQTNLVSCRQFTGTTLPVGCTSLGLTGQTNDVESVATASGILCTFFTGTACTGSSQLINGTINDLAVVGFSNKANSFTCASN